MAPHEDSEVLLQVTGQGADAKAQLRIAEARGFTGLDLSTCASTGIDEELAKAVCDFCAALPIAGGGVLRLKHCDLGSGTSLEQRCFDLIAEQEIRQSEKAFYEKKKRDSSAQKDFAVAAAMRREGDEGMAKAADRLAAISEELSAMETQKAKTGWFRILSGLQALPCNTIRTLDLSNCGLSATAVVMLTQVIGELEQRGDGQRIQWLSLDGNDLGDRSTTALASLLRLSSSLNVLLLRNVGVTEEGVSQLLSGMVANKHLALLDLRQNGSAQLDICIAALDGVRRFNKTAQILLT